MSEQRLLVVAGEASGDQRAARLIAELRRLRPGLASFGLAGDELAAAGCRGVAHSREIAVVGISEALRVLSRAREIFATLLAEVDRVRPDAAILVDSPEFNLRLAAELKRRGVPVIYYVSPQVWAWRRGRIRKIRRYVDLMLVLFPFEEEFYREHGIASVHVGHPLVDEVPTLPSAWEGQPPSFAGPFRLALLPGSRRSEVDALLPVMLEAVRQLGQEMGIDPLLILAPTIPRPLVERLVARSGVHVEISDSDRYRAVADSHLALCASGTATLEVGLLRTPMIVTYRLSTISYLLAKALVRLPHFSLVNLVCRREVVPELLQRKAEGGTLAALAGHILRSPERILAMREGLAEIRSRLGEPGASSRAARQVDLFLERKGRAA